MGVYVYADTQNVFWGDFDAKEQKLVINNGFLNIYFTTNHII